MVDEQSTGSYIASEQSNKPKYICRTSRQLTSQVQAHLRIIIIFATVTDAEQS